MPRLNTRGDYCGGVGEGVVHANEKPIAVVAGGIAWVDNDYVVYQTCEGGRCIVQSANIHNLAKWELLPHGANAISAGCVGLTQESHNTWAVWLGSSNPSEAGVTTSTGQRFPDSGLGPIGPDGALALKVAYQSAGPWDVLEPDGSRWQLTAGDARDINLLSYGQALWLEGDSVCVHSLPTVQVTLPPPYWWVKALPIAGAWWLLYQAFDGRLVSHPFDSLEGYELLPPGSLAYRPDWVVLPNGRVRVVWALSEGEQPGQVRFMDRTFEEPRTALSGVKAATMSASATAAIPNMSHVVASINSQYPHLLQTNTLETCGEFTERVVLELAKTDAGWGHVGKVGGQTQYRGHAVDAVMYRSVPDQAVDIIGGAEGHPQPGTPAWMEVPSGGQPWMAPIPVEGSSTTPPPSGGGSTDTSALEARIAALEAEAVRYGDKIGVRCNNGTVVAIMPDGGPSEPYQDVTFESRSSVGPWESLTVERGQG